VCLYNRVRFDYPLLDRFESDVDWSVITVHHCYTTAFWIQVIFWWWARVTIYRLSLSYLFKQILS
jgi:hypothetical protein